jgi:2,4-dienoyl-CoA reductase-like NADH-dependent reductase (Old Yellow Enzyme family)
MGPPSSCAFHSTTMTIGSRTVAATAKTIGVVMGLRQARRQFPVSAFADLIVRRGQADLVGIGRAMLNDAEWARKAIRDLSSR